MKLHFEVSGSGNIPLICTHGWGCRREHFAELSQRLANDFRIFQLDLPGHGQTPLGEFSPSFESYAEIIADFSREQNLDRPVLLGHSMGGVLSLIAAAGQIQPRAVINLDGGFPATEKVQAGFKLLRSWLVEPDFRQRLAGLAREAFFLPHERDARSEAIAETLATAPEPVLRFMLEQAGDLHPENILPKITVPVLYIGSATPRFEVQKTTQLIPQLQFKQIHEAGHFLNIYAAEKTAMYVRKFLLPSDRAKTI